ncbi:TOMM precursor leader peptide-binding protein [Nocardioides sp.]|uniref:TOMM precursor leader peptide-binding protein n=1 Tax=Nocardioides sp. TaxID=35761 RepID=UPI001A32D178|nr:TOMM precursor leader peptide-binding protein [Nocardioides sp.]MBJ7359356.1 TOMM precursor leader peptide-binding protein [Nocardioides sp.]
MSEPFRLLPGLRLVRRDADHVQLGVDPPRCAVLRDLPEVRRLVSDLAVGNRPPRPGPEAGRALAAIIDAGLLVPDDAAERRTRLARATLRVDAEPEVDAGVTALLEAAGVRPPSRASGRPDAVLVVRHGEVPRGILDPLVRDEVPHLLVRDHGHEIVVGPFVTPGHTACLRCLDCHLGEHDPRRGLAVEQAATQEPLVAPPVDPTLRAVALSVAVRDLVTFVEGDLPATWSATLTVGRPLDLTPTRWLRHPACGCAWGDALAG